MTYSFVKPDAGPSPMIDVVQIRTNFSQYASIFANDHIALNNANQGKHGKVILELQASDPGVNNALDVLYSKNGPSNAGSQPQLFVQIPQFLPNPNDTTSNLNLGMQLTYNTVNTVGPNQYQSFLPRGNIGGNDTGGMYLIYFGTDSGTTAPNVIISDTITLSPAPTKILIAIATPNNFASSGPAFSVNTQITSNSTFVINSLANGSGAPMAYTFGWVVIALA